MPASIRIIKIVKDKNPLTNEETDDYTVEIEVEAEKSANLAMELSTCPYGPEIVEMLRRAEFMIEISPEALKESKEKEEEEAMQHEEELKERFYNDGSEDMKDKLISYLQEHGKPATAEAIKKMLAEEEAEKKEDDSEEEEVKEEDEEPTPDIHALMPRGPRGFDPHDGENTQ